MKVKFSILLIFVLSSMLFCSSLFASDITGIPLNQAFALHPYTLPPNTVIVDRDDYGSSWEIGAYVYMGSRVHDLVTPIPTRIQPLEARPMGQEINKVNIN